MIGTPGLKAVNLTFMPVQFDVRTRHSLALAERLCQAPTGSLHLLLPAAVLHTLSWRASTALELRVRCAGANQPRVDAGRVHDADVGR